MSDSDKMASQPKRKKEGQEDEDNTPEKKMKVDEGENISRTGRQRKKSAKVLEMEAEAEELALVLRARVDPGTPRARPPIHRGPRVKKTPTRAELEQTIKEESDEAGAEAEPTADTSPPALASDTISKSGRVRKKSAKLLEMVEVEELDRKTFRTSHIPKSMRNAILPSQPTPTKKTKTQAVTSPVRSTESVSSSPPAAGPSAIKQLLSSPTKKSPGATSPPPEPILSTLGASLASPVKTVVQVPQPVASETVIQPVQPQVLTIAPAPPTATPAKDPKQEFEVKFLADCPDVVLPPKPVKKKTKKQATPTPSAPATPKSPDIGSAQKAMLPKLKNLLSPTKKTTGMAASMADQPLLSKMMGEVGQMPIGPPPPSTAEAKSMKKRAKKEAAAALKSQVESMKKKPKKEDAVPEKKQFVLPKPVARAPGITYAAPPGMPTLTLATSTPYDEDIPDEDEDKDQLMIDTSKGQAKKKKVIKKEKPVKQKAGQVIEQAAPKLELAVAPKIEPVPDVRMPTEDVGSQDDDDDDEDDGEEEDEEEDAEMEVDVEVPAYANTHVMANKVQTSTEKKASKEKKKTKKKKVPTATLR